MLAYAVISYAAIRFKLRTAVRLRGNVWQSERVDSPFIMGIFRPRVYIPFNIDGDVLENVLLHENEHIKRKDRRV